MEGLLGLEALSKMIATSAGNGPSEIEERSDENEHNNKLANTVHLLYTASKLHVYKIADKIASCAVTDEVILKEEPILQIPEADEWDFKLGDKVRIKYSLQDFKSIQTRTLGWNKRLHMVYDKIGIVTQMQCKAENAIQVYTPDVFSTSHIYAGVLEKVSEDDNQIRSQWKVGDYVKTKTVRKVVELLQRRRDTIPQMHWGEKGRVIAVTSAAIVVTFDEKKSYDINSYLLVPCEDSSPITTAEVEHARELKVGEKVQVISCLKRLIEQQKENGGWNSSMTVLRGQQVTVINIQKDRTINVQMGNGRSWRLNSDSVMRMTEVDMEIKEPDLPIMPMDKVRVKMVPNMRMILAAASVPLVFLEYLRATTIAELVDDDLDYLLQYNCNQKTSAFATSIRKATPAETEEYDEIKAKADSLKAGDKVYLDVGPPNFVKAALTEVKAKEEVMKALTTPATLVGFTSDYRAVIEYDDGSQYKIKKKFLTVPEKFNVRDTKEGLDSETLGEIQHMVLKCVQKIHDDKKSKVDSGKCTVGVYSVMYGSPPSVDLKIQSMLATSEQICDILREISGWKVDIFCSGHFMVKGLDSYGNEVKVGLIFNDEEYASHMATTQETRELTERYGEGGAVKEGAEPFVSGAAAPIPVPVEKPEIENVQDFSYLRLYDPSLARNVYFPYLVHGRRRTPVEQVEKSDGRHSTGNTYNIINSTVENISTS